MTRRDFITSLGAAVFVWPRDSIAQPSARTYRLGTLTGNVPLSVNSPDGATLLNAMAQRGYSLGRNFAYDARGAGGELSKIPQLIQDFTASGVDVILTVGYPAARHAKLAGIPTVIAYGSGDPVSTGLVNTRSCATTCRDSASRPRSRAATYCSSRRRRSRSRKRGLRVDVGLTPAARTRAAICARSRNLSRAASLRPRNFWRNFMARGRGASSRYSGNMRTESATRSDDWREERSHSVLGAFGDDRSAVVAACISFVCTPAFGLFGFTSKPIEAIAGLKNLDRTTSSFLPDSGHAVPSESGET
jgi:hypothetical protein